MKVNGKLNKPLAFFSKGVQARLGRRFRKMILFGSQARGDAHPHSDFDCLIIVDRMSDRINDHVDELAGETLCRYGIVVSAFPVSEATIKRRRYSPLLINVEKEGILL